MSAADPRDAVIAVLAEHVGPYYTTDDKRFTSSCRCGTSFGEMEYVDDLVDRDAAEAAHRAHVADQLLRAVLDGDTTKQHDQPDAQVLHSET